MNPTSNHQQSIKSHTTLGSHGYCDSHRRLPKGFALVVSLTMMILLTIIATGLLSLSAVSLRSAAQGSAHAQAQANARMALMIAIGELQKQMGPDQRISANGAIFAQSGVSHPHMTGVWDSWIAGSVAQAPVNPLYPSTESHHQTIGSQPAESMRPEYDRKDQHFRAWLASLLPEEAADLNTPSTLSLLAEDFPNAESEAVYLVRSGSLGNSAPITDHVSARLMQVDSTSSRGRHNGRYAWWVGDESQKARVMHDSYHGDTLSDASRIFRAQAPASTGTNAIPGLATLEQSQQAILAGLPSLATIDLIPGVEKIGTLRASQKNFHDISLFSRAVLADVREGGLKRDLSVLLERPIDRTEVSDDFMLYKFDIKDAWANAPSYGLPNTPQEAVPIQDLAAYYQLYDQSRLGGIEYGSGQIKTTSPNYGNKTPPWRVTQDYTGMYRQPVPVKVQFVLSLHAEEIPEAERAEVKNGNIPASDTHLLRLAVIPVVTMWNPYNVPLTMQSGDTCQSFRVRPPSFFINCVKTRATGETYSANPLNMTFAAVGGSVTTGNAEGRADLMRLNFGYTGPAVTFEPGEVRVFSMPFGSSGTRYASGSNDFNRPSAPVNHVEATSGWNSTGYYTFTNSVPNYSGNRLFAGNEGNLSHGSSNVFQEGEGGAGGDRRFSLTLADGDALQFFINAEPATTGTDRVRNVARSVAPIGSAMTHYMIQRNIGLNGYNHINLFNNSFITRMGRQGANYPGPFINQIVRQGMPGGLDSYEIEEIQARQIINATGGSTVPLMQFALKAGSEVNESIGEFGGRKYPMRPFLHSDVIAPTIIDKNDATAPYLHGWNWWMEDIGSLLSALVQNTQNGSGYFGGGYTPEAGVTQVIQQEIPVVPPISIAALSHARLGGFTLANEAPVGEGRTGTVQMEGYGGGINLDTNHLLNPSHTLGFQRVTASGQGGLFPHTLQAIGNSYAHPMLLPNQAFNDQYERIFDTDDGPRRMVFADHSYLANKALWDDFFFSSITPQPTTIPIFGGTGRDPRQVAQDFFFGNPSTPLPNRRIMPYTKNLNPAKLNELFDSDTDPHDGLADKIAAHLMVDGAFNVNSTSVEAWRVFLSSMKGKPIAYLNGGTTPQEASTSGTPVAGFSLPTSPPLTTGIIDSKNPPEQWLGTRELTDDEIDELAEAMVRQVQLRGPFLSLSEFVNRRLETATSNEEPPINLSVMGALQSAIDDPGVSINRHFRDDPLRMLDSEITGLGFPFEAAAKGPVAYGSSAYVDQADILRHLGSQMTVRGDTFIIRTYGDAIDTAGKVVARAWCEAVVQRLPEYVNDLDESYVKSGDLQFDENRQFGRRIVMLSFRWLNADEV
ncbi:MAG: hypothetical protein ACNA8L_08445 [Luteolibacter sp.]